MIRFSQRSVFLFALLFCSFCLAQDVSSAPAVVPIDPLFVPPVWLESVLMTMKGMPIFGPYIVKGMQWMGVILSVLTALTGALIVILRALSKVLNMAQLFTLVAKVENFEKNSMVVYWLKYFSAFNAPEKEKEKYVSIGLPKST
jgi:hypothetical protein